MKLIILVTIVCIFSKVSSLSTNILVASFIKPMVNDSCGVAKGAPIVQQLTRPLTHIAGLYWSDPGSKICYIDRYGDGMGRYTPFDGRFNRMQLYEGVETVMIIPVKNATSLKFMVGVNNKLVLVDITGPNNEYTLTMHDLITLTQNPEIFINGKCDDRGRLWYTSRRGKLWRIENLVPEIVLDEFECPAGMAWTKDYKSFYVVDSCAGLIFKYDYNSENGTIDNGQIVFRKVTQPDLVGDPYDVVVDTDGHLWIAMRGGGSVIQFNDTNQEVLWQIAIPASEVVSLVFGEEDKKTLFVGTAQSKLDKAQIASGAMFAISGLGVTGIPGSEIVIPEQYMNL